MTILQAIILGLVQGLTEFIPISSTAHLVFASRAINLFGSADAALRAEQTTATIAVVQLGTLVAVLIYFARDIVNITLAFVRDNLAIILGKRKGLALADSLTSDARLGWLVIIGSLPVGVIGLLFKKTIEGTFTKNLWTIAAMMVFIAIALAIAEKVGRQDRSMRDLGIKDALAVGCAQVLALIPGASRSGSTIMGGLFAGEKRETAARFSFLLSMPAIAASGLLELKEAIKKLPHGSYGPLVVATIMAGIVGYLTIWFLLRYLRTHSTGIFIGYRLVVGIGILVLLFAGIIGAQDGPPRTERTSLVRDPVSNSAPRAYSSDGNPIN